MVPHTSVNLVFSGLRLLFIAAAEPFDAARLSSQALRIGVGAGYVAHRVQRSGCVRDFTDAQEWRE